MAVVVHSSVDSFFSTCNSIVFQMEEDFKKRLKILYGFQDQALSKIKKLNNRSSATRKRKLDGINEEVLQDVNLKKLRCSNESEKENRVNNKCMSSSTPNKDSTFPLHTETEYEYIKNTRTKRNASIMASAMNNKLLNEKLTQKMRRPNSRDMNSQDVLDQQPSIVLNNYLNTKNKPVLSLPPQDLETKNEITSESKPVIANETVSEIITENNVPVDNDLEKANNTITIEKNTRPLRSTRSTNHADTSNATVDDSIMMPPPILPVKNVKRPKKGTSRNKRGKKDDITTSQIDSDISMTNDNTCDKTKLDKEVDTTKVVDESVGRRTRASAKNNVLLEQSLPLETTLKRRANRKNKAASKDEPDNIAEVEKSTKTHPRNQGNSSDSDEEFEAKKVKLRPKRTRKGKEQVPHLSPIPSTERSSDEKVEKHPSNDSGVSSSGKLEKVVEGSKDKKASPEIVSSETKPVKSPRKTRSLTRVVDDKVSSPPKTKNDVQMNTSYVISSNHPVKTTKKALNETIVLENNVPNGQTPNKKKLPVATELPTTQQRNLNTTITISTNGDNTQKKIMDQTVTIVKGSLIQCDPNVSLLTDDLSDVDATPPRNFIPEIITKGYKKLKEAFMESPVKSKVQHFEQLAGVALNKSPVKAVNNVDAPTRVTRTKTRALAAHESQEIQKSEESQEESVVPIQITKKASRSKIATPLSGRIISQLKLPLPVPPAKQVGSSVRLAPAVNNGNISPDDLLMSPKNVGQIVTTKDDHLRKRDAMLQARSEEQRRKREEKCRAAAIAREAQQKRKMAQLEKAEKEKEEKLRQLQLERDEKLKEEAEKKRLAIERKLQEIEERRKAEEAARQARLLEQEEEAKRQAAIKRKQQEEAEKYKKKIQDEERELAAAKKLQETKNQAMTSKHMSSKKTGYTSSGQKPFSYKAFEDLATEDESEDEKNIKRPLPTWVHKTHRRYAVKIQDLLKGSIIDKLYSTTIFNPNLMEIFPNIDRRHLVRTSSAVWKTPPRFSMMPKG